MDNWPHLPLAQVRTTPAADYMTLLAKQPSLEAMPLPRNFKPAHRNCCSKIISRRCACRRSCAIPAKLRDVSPTLSMIGAVLVRR